MSDTTEAVEKTDEAPSAGIDLGLLNETLEYIRPALQADGAT